MNSLRNYALPFLLLIFGTVAWSTSHAQVACPPTSAIPTNNVLVCWTNATENVPVPPETIGTPIPATGPDALKTTTVQRAQVAASATCAFGTIAQTLNVTPDVTRVYFENLPDFKHCFRVKHVNNADASSAWSGTVSKTTTTPQPPAPPKSKPPTISIY